MMVRLLVINVAVFLALTLVRIAGFLFNNPVLGDVMPWISGSSSWKVMLYRPWSLFTYMFVHESLGHIFFNLLLFYFSARIFEDLLNGKRLLAVYIMGGIAGFLLYFLAFNIFPVFSGSNSIIYGASASVIAVLVAIATYTPDLELRLILIGNVKLKYIAIFFVALDILFLDGGNTGGRLAHLGGAAYGYWYSVSLKKGNDWSKGFYSFTGFFKDLVKPSPKMKVASKNANPKPKAAAKSAPDRENEKKVDSILDKISHSGYDSLTKAEKEFLFNASKKG